MSDKNRKLLGICSCCIPAVMILSIIITIITCIIMAAKGINSEVALPVVIIMACLLILSLIGSVALLIYYIIMEINDLSESSTDKVLWVLGLLFLHWCIIPFYWYFRIWKRDFTKPPFVENTESNPYGVNGYTPTDRGGDKKHI